MEPLGLPILILSAAYKKQGWKKKLVGGLIAALAGIGGYFVGVKLF